MMVMPFEKYSMLGYYAAGLVLSLLIGLGLVVSKRPGRSIDVMLLVLAPVFAYILGGAAFFAMIGSPWQDWNAGRLAPTVSLFHGYRLYHGPNNGPIYNTIYPPISYLTYLPAGLFHVPSSAIMAAEAINLLMIFVPMLAICFARHGDTGQSRVPLFSMFAFFGIWRIAQTLAWYLSEQVHADSPAVCYAMLACAVLYARRFDEKLSWRTAWISTFFAALALGCKQTTLPLVLALPLWVLLANGLRTCGRYSVALMVNLAWLSGLLYLTFGRWRLTFNIIELPRNHPWRFDPDFAKGFGVLAVELIIIASPLLVALPILAYLARREQLGSSDTPRPATRLEALRDRLRGDSWLLFATVGVAMIPTAMLSRIKVGGSTNGYGIVIAFLGVSCFVLAMDWCARNRERGLESANDALKLLAILSPLSPLWMFNASFVAQFNTWKNLADNPQDVAYRYAQAHPGEAFYPWNSLSGLMAEGKASHFEYGMFDRMLAKYPPTPAHLRKFIPPDVRIVAFAPVHQSEWSMTLLPEFKRRVEIKELPGWVCYER